MAKENSELSPEMGNIPEAVTLEKIPSSAEYIEKLREFGSEEHVKAYEKVIEITQAIKEAEGQGLLVGGCVRDMLLGQISKDFDLEVYSIEPEKLEEIVSQFGKVSEVGKSFGVLKLSLGEGIDIDVSLPRTDSKVGEGHKGFAVKADPNMSIEEAARRRDFTINSMAADPLTGKLHDPFNGLQDLKERRLKITDPERFKDDPLRVMRAIQFIGRFGLSLDQESAKTIQEMSPQLKELSKVRIFEEWKKLLLKSEKPSLGLSAGMALGVFKEIHPEFPPLIETSQEPKWHPEGDVWIHTLMTVDEAAKIIRRENLEPDKALTIMLTMLCHDLGKPKTTRFRDEKLTSYGHEQAGEEPTKKFLASLGVDNLTRKEVIKLVKNHLIPTTLWADEVIRGQKIKDVTFRRWAERMHPTTLHELTLVAEADHTGRGPWTDPETPDQLLLPDGFPAGPWFLQRARELGVEKSRPQNLISGRDLINFGYEEGKGVGMLIELADALRDKKDFTKEMVFQALDGIEDEKAAIVKLQELLRQKKQKDL